MSIQIFNYGIKAHVALTSILHASIVQLNPAIAHATGHLKYRSKGGWCFFFMVLAAGKQIITECLQLTNK